MPREKRNLRQVRSYVLRGGRLTEGQKKALRDLWPKYGIPDGSDVLDFAQLFGNARPVILEIGFGNGDATWRMAAREPGTNFVGVEVHRPGVGRLLLKLEQHAIGNVRVACEDAVDWIQRRVPEASLDGVRIYFPDPWPKKRHHKRRLVQDPFVELLATRMKPGAVLHLATDWAPYAEHMRVVLGRCDGFHEMEMEGDRPQRPGWRPQTKYEKRGERLGHRVYDLVFRRADWPGRSGEWKPD